MDEHAAIMPERFNSIPMTTYSTIDDLDTFFNEQAQKIINRSSTHQYAVVRKLPWDVYDRIESRTFTTAIRTSYNYETGDMIVKLMPGQEHEAPHLEFAMTVRMRLERMGVSEDDILSIGAARHMGFLWTKEADSSLKPLPARERRVDWPAFVVECGISESLDRLHTGAEWWLSNSDGAVKLVVLISFDLRHQFFHIETWEMRALQIERQRTESVSCELRLNQYPPAPTRTKTISIELQGNGGPFVASDDLTIKFRNVMLRDPIPPETDIHLTRNDLQRWAMRIVSGLK